MKKIIYALIIMFILGIGITIFAFFQDEDFQPYSNKNIDVNKSMNGNVFVIQEIENQLQEVVNSYQTDMQLKYAKYFFPKENNMNAKFYYYKQMGDNRNKIITLYVDTENKILSNIKIEEGIAKRVSLGHYDGISDECKLTNVYEHYQNYINENDINLYSSNDIVTVTTDISITKMSTIS